MGPIAAIVITYLPGLEVSRNILSYLDQVDHLYITDNSLPKHSFPQELLEHPKITVIRDGGNEGIAVRLNQVAAMALRDGYGWLLTMDQDSYFDTDNIQSYFDYVAEYPQAAEVAMFGVETVQKPALIADLNEPVDRLITSGSLVNLTLYNKIGPFDEQLFIDEVDHEYCYRAAIRGYHIIQFTHIFLEHQLGESVEVRTVKGYHKRTSFHAPVRLYYMVRNFLYVRARYKDIFQKDLKIRGIALLHRLKNNLLYGPHKWGTLKMIFAALNDYKKGKMGKKI